MNWKLLITVLVLGFQCVSSKNRDGKNTPVVVTTWRFVNATLRAWEVLDRGGLALDAVEQGASVCEEQQCDGTVGYGGSPDENGETTLDAMIMDGKTMNVGAVADLRRIKSVISVARHILEHTKHSIIAGDQATQFAVQMGFKEETLTTPTTKKMWKKWRNEDSCQPNFWLDVTPDPKTHCGPYRSNKHPSRQFHHNKASNLQVSKHNHDTIGMVAIDKNGDIAAGTSTNGAKFKIPGRVGDSPIPGAGAYADNSVGGATATGDGDVMLRFLPSFLAVEEMRRGATPTAAAWTAINRIKRHYPDFMGAVLALNKNGVYGAACNGIPEFHFVVKNSSDGSDIVKVVKC